MNVLQYVRHIADTIPEDTLVVTSHTLPTLSWISMQKSNPALINLNMGLATPFGLGLALALPHRKVIVLDSDGGNMLLTNVLADLAAQNPPNLTVVIHDNESMLYVPSHTAGKADLAMIAHGCGIENAQRVDNLEDFEMAFADALSNPRLTYIVAKSERGRLRAPEGLTLPIGPENTYDFVRQIERLEGKSIIGRGWRVGGWG